MKTWSLAVIFGLLLQALAPPLLAQQVAQQEFIFATYLSSRHNMNRGGVAPYFERVTAATDGALTFTLYTDGTMVSGRNTLQAIRNNVIDMGLVVDLFVPGYLRTSALLGEMALLLDDPWVTAGAANEMQLLHCQQCETDLTRNHIKQLVMYAANPFYLQCNRADMTLADMPGKRVRAVGPWAKWVAAMGATPVNITGGEVYEALERGQIDCTMGALAWLRTYSLKDVVESIVMLPTGVFAGGSMINMNTARWATLSTGQKQAFVDNGPQLVVDITTAYTQADDVARQLGEEKGIQFLTPQNDMVQLFAQHKRAEFKRVAALAEQRDIPNAEALLNKYAEVVDKWRAIVAETGNDREAFKQHLQREIFSKIVL